LKVERILMVLLKGYQKALLLVNWMGSMTEILTALKLVHVKVLLMDSMKEGWMV